MAIYLEDIKTGNVLKAGNARRPKFGGRGRSWDYCWKQINGRQVRVDLDSTWGKYGYFQWNNRWYRMITEAMDDFSFRKYKVISKKDYDTSYDKLDDGLWRS